VPPDEQISARLTEIIHPVTLNQVAHFHQLGLRERVLTLPIMVALVVSLIWRQVGGVCDLMHLVVSEMVLWVPPLQISQQALSERLRTLPADLFLQVLLNVLPRVQAAWQSRQRPLPPEIAWAQAHYAQVAIVDGSTLDALIRKVGLLRDTLTQPLAGRMTALLDLCSRLPLQIWYEDDAQANDQRFWSAILAALPAGGLLIFDLGLVMRVVLGEIASGGCWQLSHTKASRRDTVGWDRPDCWAATS
jgi:hypothetical protein